jgi:hypothetical protein
VRPRLPILLLLTCALLPVAGCAARQSKDQYQDRLTHAATVRTSVSDELARNHYSSPDQYAHAAQQVTDAADELSADQPPRGVASAHERMLAGMDGLQALLSRLGRCAALKSASDQDARACRQSISQDVYDEIRNDFGEADTIYRQEGLSLPGQGGDEAAGGTVGRDDVLDEPTDTNEG